MNTRSRIAPTPSGYLHTGNAFNFILTWLLTKKENGNLRLRIDDLDAPRARPEYVQDIFESLEWLGISWDEGPKNPTEHYSTFSQQSRMERYRAIAEHLREKADCFYCVCTRSDKDSCSCSQKAFEWKQNETALKIKTTSSSKVHFFDEFFRRKIEVNIDAEMKDFVIWRKDGIPSYQLASLVDDLEFGTNLVVRGQDLISSTGAQLFLAQKLGRNEFTQARFFHHPLQADERGNKLSKSAGSNSLKSMRQRGLTATEIYRQFAVWLGWTSVPKNLSDSLVLLTEYGF